MFDGKPDQFLAPTTSLPPSFSLHHTNFQQQQCFDASYILQQQVSSRNENRDECGTNNNSMIPTCLVQVGSEPSTLMVPQCVVEPWSSEEVLSLLKIISSLDNPWFPSPFTWDNVSRKLAEVGFKRSAVNCKEKFEEQTRSFNNNRNKNNNVISQNYRLFGELEELYNNSTNTNNNNNANNDNDGNYANHHQLDDNTFDDYPSEEINKNDHDSGNDNDNSVDEEGDKEFVEGGQEREEDRMRVVRKRKREKKFEMFKGFCEKIVSKIIAQQEEMHCKVLEDMVKREEEKIAREEAWKKQEIDRITQVMEVRAHEQAIVGDRQVKILGFLKNFSSLSSNNTTSLLSTSSSILSQDSFSATPLDHQDSLFSLVNQQQGNIPTSSSKENLVSQSPNRQENPPLVLPLSPSSLNQPSKSSTTSPVTFDHTSTNATSQIVNFDSSGSHTDSKTIVGDVKDETGRRWPRDEVLALINIRCNLFGNNGDHRDRETLSKGPLWERISQKMMELGYKRSAKRCKEKWENINKYFRKTKDLNKKRSIDSRTCPYFHQLSYLYNQQEASHDQYDRPENLVSSPGKQSVLSNGATPTNMASSQQNEDSIVQVPTYQVSSAINFDYNVT